MGGVHVPPAGFKICVLVFSVGPEGETREPGDNSGAEQHLSTSGQSEQTSALHPRFHPSVTEKHLSALLRPQATSNKRASTGYF